MDHGDPLLSRIEEALELNGDGDGEAAARGCLDVLRTEAKRFRDRYLDLSLQLLTEALRAPPSTRHEEVQAALLVCRRTILSGRP